jgi:ABC-type Fe3+/spermidine/putrescine transport system ATPase subunit
MVADFMGLVNLVPGTVCEKHGAGGRVEVAPQLTVEVGALDGLSPGDAVEVAIRPENIRLSSGAWPSGAPATISNHVFLGNISEYYANLLSGPTLRVQTHPSQHFEVGEACKLEIDATHCSVFRPGDEASKVASQGAGESDA